MEASEYKTQQEKPSPQSPEQLSDRQCSSREPRAALGGVLSGSQTLHKPGSSTLTLIPTYAL